MRRGSICTHLTVLRSSTAARTRHPSFWQQEDGAHTAQKHSPPSSGPSARCSLEKGGSRGVPVDRASLDCIVRLSTGSGRSKHSPLVSSPSCTCSHPPRSAAMMAPGGSETAAGGEAAPAASRREEDLPSSLRSHYAPLAAPPTAHRPLHVLLATTGSVASVKAPSIVKALLAHEHVRVFMVPTKASLHFYNADELESDVKREEQARRGGAKGGTSDSVYTCRHLAAENEAGKDALRNTSSGPLLAPRLKVWHEEHDWSDWDSVGDPVLHIELRRWADVVLVAPCSANTLAKIHAGICDNLLVRPWWIVG